MAVENTMPAVVSRFQEGPDRKRRAHAKSRKGCGNCKLRRVKCDESKPRCKKCLSYGVSCDYDGSKPSLDLAAQGSFQVDLNSPSPGQEVIDFNSPPLRRSPVSINSNTTSMINASLYASSHELPTSTTMNGIQPLLRVSHWTFTEADLEIMKRFQERTVSTIGTSRTAPTYRDCICHLAFTHPFLMHMVLSLTLMHDAHLAASQCEDLATTYLHASLKHWNTATKLFNHILSRPIPPSYRDAVWATGALLGTAGFAYVETTNAEKAWPLKPSDPTDLDWLKLSEGKKAIWVITNPTRPDSIFRDLAKDMNHAKTSQWDDEPDFSFLPAHLKRLFEITPHSSLQNNVYYFPILALSRLNGLQPNHDNVISFLYFMAFMPSDFKNLLELKDPRALLLLLWWFRKLDNGTLWWLTRRAKVEGRAIEIWLERWYGGEEGLARMFESMRQTGFEEDMVEDVESSLPAVMHWVKERNDESCPVQ